MTNWSADDLFQWWIVQQQSAVMVHLGKITHPMTGKVERDLDTAKFLIDLLGVMEVKTKGNLSGDEQRLLGGVLTNLRLNFVQEANRPDTPDTGPAGEPAGEGSDAEGDEANAAGKDSDTAGAGSSTAGDGPSGAAGDVPGDAGDLP
jgi:hypothetical protein